MSLSNSHNKPFDEATHVKLRLFQDYICEWLPVFLMSSPLDERINIVDFFAGPGYDKNGAAGSPLLALEELRKYEDRIRDRGVPVHLLFNEKDERKATELRYAMDRQDVPPEICLWDVTHKEFEVAFSELYSTLAESSNLILLDQSGFKSASDEIFDRLLTLRRTDYIFFIAASSIRRFEEHPYIRQYLSIPKGTISSRQFYDTHRAVADYYRRRAPSNQEHYIGHFSIQKRQ